MTDIKTIDFFWDHPALGRFRREVKAGEFLFQQKQPGNTMFIILKGLVELVAQRGDKEYVINIVPAGQFLGEKAIVKESPYQRAYAARAKVDSTILEMGLKAIEAIRKAAPEIMNDIFKHIFQIAAERLDRANYLTAGLRSSNNAERLIHLVLYFSRSTGRPGPDGIEFLMKPESVSYYIDMPQEKIEGCINELLVKSLLKRASDDCFILPSEQELLKSLPQLKEQWHHGHYDELEVAP